MKRWLVVLLLITGMRAFGQASLVKRVVEEGVETIFRRAGKDALKELEQIGGKEAVRSVLERSAEEGGDVLVKKVTSYGVEHGAIALRVLGRSPLKMAEALDGLAPGLRTAALQAVERQPLLLTRLTEKYGKVALEAAVRHPGVGEQIVESLGREGITATQNLTTDQAIIVARHADEIARLPEAQRTGVLQRIATGGKQALDCLEDHPRVLFTTAGVMLFIEGKDELIGTGSTEEETNGNVTTHRTKAPGLIPRIWGTFTTWVKRPLGIAVTGLSILFGGWIAFTLWAMWRRRLAEVRLADAKAAAAMSSVSMPNEKVYADGEARK